MRTSHGLISKLGVATVAAVVDQACSGAQHTEWLSGRGHASTLCRLGFSRAQANGLLPVLVNVLVYLAQDHTL